MKAGISNIIITPDLDDREKPLQLAGYLPRELCTGVHDDLFARCIYLEGEQSDISTHIIMIICDLIAIDKNLASIAKIKISKIIPILPENIMISATHTHHGPDYNGTFNPGGALGILKGFLFPVASHKDKLDFIKKIIKVARDAYTSRIDALMGINQGFISNSERVMFNRRDPLKPETAQYPVSVIKLIKNEGKDKGQLYGLVINYSVHGTILPRYNTLITADYVGYVIKYLEGQYPNNKGKILYFNGPCGEINPLSSELENKLKKVTDKSQLTDDDLYDQIGTWEDAERIGSTIAKNAINIMEKITVKDYSQFIVRNKKINIPIKDYNYGSDISSAIRRFKFIVKRKFMDVLCKLNILKTNILISVENILNGYIDTQIQVIDLGCALIFTVPAEYFLELGNEVLKYSKSIYPQKTQFMVELANDDVGYLYTIESYLAGGYESSFSLTPLGGRFLTMQLKKIVDSHGK